MKKYILFIFGLFISLLILSSWSSEKNQDEVFVAISMTTKGKLQNGYGIVITLTNVETKVTVKSQSLGPISAHSIFKELTPGRYVVSKVEVPLGELIYINESIELTDYFGILEFDKDKSYYLGNFKGQREVGKQNVFHIKLGKREIHPKLLKKLSKNRIDIKEYDLIKTFPYSKDILTIY